MTAFQQGLKEEGFVEGQNVSVEYRSADNQLDRTLCRDSAVRKLMPVALPVISFSTRARIWWITLVGTRVERLLETEVAHKLLAELLNHSARWPAARARDREDGDCGDNRGVPCSMAMSPAAHHKCEVLRCPLSRRYQGHSGHQARLIRAPRFL